MFAESRLPAQDCLVNVIVCCDLMHVCVLDEMHTPEHKGITRGLWQATWSARMPFHPVRVKCEKEVQADSDRHTSLDYTPFGEDHRIQSEREFKLDEPFRVKKGAQRIVAASRHNPADIKADVGAQLGRLGIPHKERPWRK